MYVAEKQGYSSIKIEGATHLEEAERQALDIYLDLQKGAKQARSTSSNGERSRSSPGATKKSRIQEQVHSYLSKQQERVEQGLIKPGSLRNTKKALINWFLPYCKENKLIYTTDIKVGILEDFVVFCGNGSGNTIKGHLTNITTFLRSISRERLIDPYAASIPSEITPKLKIRNVDLTANPPFRDEE